MPDGVLYSVVQKIMEQQARHVIVNFIMLEKHNQ